MKIESVALKILGFLVLMYLGIFLIIYLRFYQTLSHCDLVISRYKESVAYLHNPIFQSFRKIYLYNKGPNIGDTLPDNVIVSELPNVGCEGHTYLEHIRFCSDREAEKTLFLPGSWVDTWYKKEAFFTIMYLAPYKNFVGRSDFTKETVYKKFEDYSRTSYQHSHKNNKSATAELALCADRPYGNWYHKHFSERQSHQVTYCGVFLVGHDLIETNPPELYSALQADLSISPNPEAGHYMERSWAVLFHQ
jgi:hypothetical protein